jgi:transcriptional regulator with XRE-family HTH domain
MAKRSATNLDRVVGRNIRLCRQAKGLSQSDLAEKLGITFQQIQKYEKGVNRVGAGRLFQIAAILAVPISSLFEEGGGAASEQGSPVDSLSDPLSLRLVQAFSRLSDSRSRLALVTVAESMNAAGKG